MKHLKRFFESTNRPNHNLTKDDIEDVLLELVDNGYKVEDFDTGYFNKTTRNFKSMPADGYQLAYKVYVSVITEDEDYDDEDWVPYSTLEEIKANIQKKHNAENLVINVLTSAKNRLKSDLIIDYDNERSFTLFIIPQGFEALKVDQKETDFYRFLEEVRQRLRMNLSGNSDFTLESDPNTFKVTIKFSNNLTRSRYNTAIRNIEDLKTGMTRSRGVSYRSATKFKFEIWHNYTRKEATLEFTN